MGGLSGGVGWREGGVPGGARQAAQRECQSRPGARRCTPLQAQHAAFVAFYLDMAKGTALGQLVAGMVRKAERARPALLAQAQAGGAAAADDERPKAAVLAALSSNVMLAPATAVLDPAPSRKLPEPVGSGGAQPMAAAQRASRLRPPSNR